MKREKAEILKGIAIEEEELYTLARKLPKARYEELKANYADAREIVIQSKDIYQTIKYLLIHHLEKEPDIYTPGIYSAVEYLRACILNGEPIHIYEARRGGDKDCIQELLTQTAYPEQKILYTATTGIRFIIKEEYLREYLIHNGAYILDEFIDTYGADRVKKHIKQFL